MLAFSLCGCATVNADIDTRLGETLANVQSEATKKPSYNHILYSYYSNPSIGKIYETRTSNTFTYNGNKFIMTLNASSIMTEAYYSDEENEVTVNEENLITSLSGEYTDYENTTKTYTCAIYQAGDYYFTEFLTDTMLFYGFSDNDLSATDLAGEMLRIARTVSVDEEEIYTLYSNRQEVTYSRKKLELFQEIAPEEGAIDELLDLGDTHTGIGDNYDEDNYGDTIETTDEITAEATEETDTQIESDDLEQYDNLHDTIE